jgi:hypothetical protein
MPNGNLSALYFHHLRVGGAGEQMTGGLLMELFGCCDLGHDGRTCQDGMGATPLAIDASRSGKA